VRFKADKVTTGTGLSPFISLSFYQYHSTNFAFTSSQALFLSEGQAGEPWASSNEATLSRIQQNIGQEGPYTLFNVSTALMK
jgi:prophage maintenance system killer protein